MNSENKAHKDIKTGKKHFKVKSKDKKKEFEITVSQEKVDFEEGKKEAKVKAKVITRKVENDKVSDEGKEEKENEELTVEYGKGTFWDNLELKKVGSDEIDGKKKFGGSFR